MKSNITKIAYDIRNMTETTDRREAVRRLNDWFKIDQETKMNMLSLLIETQPNFLEIINSYDESLSQQTKEQNKNMSDRLYSLIRQNEYKNDKKRHFIDYAIKEYSEFTDEEIISTANTELKIMKLIFK